MQEASKSSLNFTFWWKSNFSSFGAIQLFSKVFVLPFAFEEFLYKMHLIQKKIDEEIDDYISKEKQLEFISEYFKFEQLLNEWELCR